MPFSNPIVGGTTLIRPAIQSPDFVTGVSGWRIAKNGSAEFNEVDVRGQVIGLGYVLNQDGLFFYDSVTGKLVGSWAHAAGVDGGGNSYPVGLTLFSADGLSGTINLNESSATWNALNGSGIQILVAGGSVAQQFAPALVGGVTWNDGAVGSTFSGRLGTNTPQLFIVSPANSATPTDATISLYGAPQTSNGDVLSEAVIDASRVWANTATGWITGAWSKLSEVWQVAGGNGAAFNAGWSASSTFNGSTGWPTVQYRKDAEDNLVVTGCFKTTAGWTTGGSPFTMPAAFRPSKQWPVAVQKNVAGTLSTGMGQISAGGNLNLLNGSGVAPVASAEYLVTGVIPLGNIA